MHRIQGFVMGIPAHEGLPSEVGVLRNHSCYLY